MPVLPEDFKELEPYIGWSLSAERERMAKRESTPMEDITDFYDHIFKHLERIVTYLNQYSYDEMPEDAQNLCNMMLSLVEVCNLVEMYKNPEVLRMVSSERFVSLE